jgi:uncharacterized phage infection (PIP) family protein YhgE
MGKCLNCGSNNVAVKSIKNSCPSCSRPIISCVECGCTKSIYCPDCQQKAHSSKTQQSELLTENRQLTTTLNSAQRQLKELQAEVRTLESQLTEQEDLTKILNSVKSKLKE